MKQDKAKKPSSDEASDEDIIFSESQIEVKGELITVSEINYMQGMQVHQAIQPMIAAMADAFAEDNPGLSLISGVFANHQQVVNDLLLMTTGKDESWLHQLGDKEGQMLLMTFWMVNTGFFTRRLSSLSLHRMQQKHAQTQTH